MSEADGLRKLTEFLNQTRKQAEVAVDCLNERIRELELEREKYLGERDYYKNYAEQLRVENSKKWRLQERDDWKALVDSVQQDRSRLQDECHKLEDELQEAYAELHRLEEERHNEKIHRTYQEETDSTPPVSDRVDEDFANEECLNGTVNEPENNQSNIDGRVLDGMVKVDTPPTISILDSSPKENSYEYLGRSRSGSRTSSPRSLSITNNGSMSNKTTSPLSLSHSPRGNITPNSSHRVQEITPAAERDSQTVTPPPFFQNGDNSPRAVVRELRKELAKAQSENQILRKTAETESLAQEQEITRLREEVAMLKNQLAASNNSSAAPTSKSGENRNVKFASFNDEVHPPIPPPPISNTSSGITSFLSSPFSVLGYFFSYSSSTPSPEPHTSTQYV